MIRRFSSLRLSLLRISTRTSPEAESAVSDIFEGVFGRAPVVETKPGVSAATVSIYADTAEWTAGKAKVLRDSLRRHREAGPPVGPVRVQTIRREDWAESWKRHFKPIHIGRRLLIKPGWSRQRPRKGEVVVMLDPGLSFGTGQHHTTKFCLDHLTACRRADQKQSLLDVGTGSGILAIAAAKLGYRPVHAIDNDPDAIRIARANARRNRVERRIVLGCKDLSKLARAKPAVFDVVCANLIADLLISQAERISRTVRCPRGILLASGILNREFGEVAARFAAHGLRLVESQRQGPWRSGVFRSG
jgi:ribosomal protein L11 methyltransferase